MIITYIHRLSIQLPSRPVGSMQTHGVGANQGCVWSIQIDHKVGLIGGAHHVYIKRGCSSLSLGLRCGEITNWRERERERETFEFYPLGNSIVK